MDEYEAEIARQPAGPFTRRRERQTIRFVADEHISRKRFTEERRRRLVRYSGWVGIASPIIFFAIKLVESFAGK